jgi:hypothetical protein
MATKPKDYSWTEPASDWNAIPPFNNVQASESGHSFEMDDTPGAERVRLQHRTGTFTEIQANGQKVVKIVGDKYEIIASNNNVLISGVCNITVEGDSVMWVKGDSYSQVDGASYQTVKGKTNINSTDNIEIFTEGDIDLNALGSTSSINLRASDSVNIHSDVNVFGSLIGRQSISAVENVTAGLQLSSFLGVETFGPVLAGGPVISAVSVFAPLVAGVIVSDSQGPMDLIRFEFDIHRHFAKGGLTSLPVAVILL